MDVDGTVAIVTGGNGGLGQRICHALADAGSNVAVVYAQSKQDAEGVADDLRKKGVRARAFQCDIASPDQVSSMASQVQDEFGRIDILVNDAVYNKWIEWTDLDAMTYEDWSKMLDVNLTGHFLCAQAVAPAMKRQGAGRIVNISSVSGMYPSGSSIGYSVAKAGLNHLTKCLAVALAPEVLVNCIPAGFLEGTRATSNLPEAMQKNAREGSLLKRAAHKDDIAQQVVAFCRTDSMTGQNLVMDAGRFFH